AAAREVGLPAAEVTVAQGLLPGARWIAVWRQMRRWLGKHFPEVDRTLRPPVDPSVVAELEEMGFGPVAPAVVGCWLVFDGQDAAVDSLADELEMPLRSEDADWSHGLFGGYAAYDHEVSTILLPLKAALRLTLLLQDRIPALKTSHPTKLAFACSFNFSKILLVDVTDGSVFAWTRRPTPLIEPACPASDAESADGLLRWVEEYARRLYSDIYKPISLRSELAPVNRGICLFPMSGPDLSVCVTRGVEVAACCVYMPEHPQGWTYSITFRLVASPEERGFKTCQLQARHWEISEGDAEPEHVRGEGVIGFFPILTDGGWILNKESDPHQQYAGPHRLMQEAFRYQSCSGRRAGMRGTFGGSLTFVPGTIRSPTGSPFEVRMEPFGLFIPEFVF
ncbi:unnamed protein product, partial [Polarella glacialis]